MRCGILIIGSLLWDSGKTGERAAWRAARLDTGAQVPVRASLYYGRRSGSRGDTYTMAFRPGEASARCIVVPCTEKAETVEKLVAEANALWQAEDLKAKPGSLHKSWGCVGALFRPKPATETLAAGWSEHFQNTKTRCVSVVNADGFLGIGWPDG
ncbi:MAG TPA: hypothetical protein DEG79_01590, partial [Hyphomonas sp.]|nr:hypothetical protein [Hyphomonas sp.]